MNKRITGKAVFFIVLVIMLAAMNETIFSGNYHSGSGLICSDCHTMHNQADGTVYNGGIPQNNMLKVPSANDLCVSCHDGDTGAGNIAPDVFTTAGAGQATNRGAGAFRAALGVETSLGHDIGFTTSRQAPGSNPAWWTTGGVGMTCANCHDPHGNAYYRNLKPQRGGAAAVYVDDVTEGVLTPTATQYNVTNVTYTGDKMSQWCAGCHTDFYLSPYGATFTNDANMGGQDTGDTVAGTTNQWHRHPASHVTFTEANTNGHFITVAAWQGLSSRLPYIDSTANGPTGDDMIFCGTCHKAHGSDKDRSTAGGNPANLIYDDSTTATIQDGTSLLQICQTCHSE